MKVEFRFMEGKSQIILDPSNNIDQANLENVLALKGTVIEMSAGAQKNLIIESRVEESKKIENPDDLIRGFIPSDKDY